MDEKILNILTQMQNDISQINNRLDKVDSRLDKMDSRLDKMDERLDAIQEDTQITRAAVNSLIEWADCVGIETKIDFPIKRVK